MRDEFERNRYWFGIYRTDVEFDEGLGEFGRYVSSGAREVDTGDLETFNERWEAYANAWSFQQKKLDDLKQIVDARNGRRLMFNRNTCAINIWVQKIEMRCKFVDKCNSNVQKRDQLQQLLYEIEGLKRNIQWLEENVTSEIAKTSVEQCQ